MIEPKYVSLIHRRLDGEITPREDEELTQYLAGSPDGRALYELLSQTIRVVSGVSPVNPPARVKEEVLASIESHHGAHSVARRQKSMREIMLSVFTPRLAYGLATGLILGVALGTIGLRSMGNQGIDPSSLAGTIVSGNVPSDSQRLDLDAFENSRFSGAISVDRVQGAIWIRLQIESDGDVAVTLTHGASPWTLRGFAQSDPDQSVLETTNNGLYLTHSGKNSYVFILGDAANPDSPISVRLEEEGVAYQRDINTRSGS